MAVKNIHIGDLEEFVRFLIKNNQTDQMDKKFKVEVKIECNKTKENWNLSGRMIMEHINS
ncbi:hypothetical protein CWN83_21290 [Vibrio splendidus]|nr:hypothetical protein CWN83_21290 [Vibrio splendidus]